MRSIFALLLLIETYCAQAQVNYLKIHAAIVLPKDSLESHTLIASLNEFLLAAQKPDSANRFVCEGENVETMPGKKDKMTLYNIQTEK